MLKLRINPLVVKDLKMYKFFRISERIYQRECVFVQITGM